MPCRTSMPPGPGSCCWRNPVDDFGTALRVEDGEAEYEPGEDDDGYACCKSLANLRRFDSGDGLKMSTSSLVSCNMCRVGCEYGSRRCA